MTHEQFFHAYFALLVAGWVAAIAFMWIQAISQAIDAARRWYQQLRSR